MRWMTFSAFDSLEGNIFLCGDIDCAEAFAFSALNSKLSHPVKRSHFLSNRKVSKSLEKRFFCIPQSAWLLLSRLTNSKIIVQS